MDNKFSLEDLELYESASDRRVSFGLSRLKLLFSDID